MSELFSEDEIATLREGAMGAGFYVSMSDRGFFDTFKEAGTLGKHIAEARTKSESAVVRKVAEGKGPHFGVTAKPEEIEAGTLEALHASVALLQAKAPEELDAYRAFVRELVQSVAAAAAGGEEVEAAAIAKIEAALG